MGAQSAAPRLTEVDYDPFASPELARAVPTTDAQREVWLADQLGREASLAFNESITLRLRGTLHLQALQDALLALSDRHESLRSTFSADGMNMLIAPRGSLQARLLDLSARNGSAPHDAMAALVHAEVTTPFDLVKGPLARATLMTRGAAEHELVLTAHHIVCDGWSFGVISRELTALYAAFVAGRQPALAPADSFGDYVLGGNEATSQQAAEADERYWVSVFDGSVPVLDLPTDRPRKPVREFASRREDLVLVPEVVEAARKLGASHGASLFATLFSLFAALMARLGHDPDVVVGVPAAGQAASGMNNLVGHCVNLLPVRVFADLSLPVADLLRHGRTRVLDAYEHQSCTFGRLLSRLQIGRDAGRLPLVSVQFNVDSAIRAEELSSPTLRVELASNAREYENFDLFVNASQFDGRIVLECQYNLAQFDAATVRRWLHLYKTAIERAASNPAQPTAALFAAADEDRERVAEWNRTEQDYPRDARVEQLIAAQAARTPQAVAVVDHQVSMTYGELEERANALAHALVAQGVGAGQLVGLACGRNRHLLVGLLGILKTGAGYVPLDPGFPADRLAHMRSDAKLAWLVSDSSVKLEVGGGDLRVLWADSVTPSARPPRAATDPAATAYVIYTSGSTGKPKGVAVPQRAVVNFLTSMARSPGLTAGDRLVAVTTPSFDIAVLELLLPLTLGAQVVLASRETVMDGPALRALIERQQATAMQATPSGWRLRIDAGWTGGAHFKALVGGEALPSDLAGQMIALAGEVWNMYGPTETTVWSTCWRVQAAAPISIGRPISNTVVEVLDEGMRPCPIGVSGELFIGGDGVALGYHQRPELTAERFVADPSRPGRRLYRTGDRGRWRNDGLLEHLGRLDNQVKVRGYRIELGEIEANLVTHDGIERAVVVAREDVAGDVRIVAYVVGRAGAGAIQDASSLREHLRRTLPEYMLPAHFVALPNIPLLPNGKVDRKSLPRPDAQAGERRERRRAETALEARVVALMEEVLHLPEIGVDEDFFALGGHSLLAAKLTSRLNSELDLALPLRTVFEAATAQRLAAAVGQARGTPGRPQVEHDPILQEAPLTVMQERIRFMEQMHPGRVVYNTPSAHRLRGPFDEALFEAALQRLVARQPALRTVIVDGPGAPVQRVLPEIPWQLPRIDLSALGSEVREAELMRRMQAIIDEPIPLDRAPLFRMALYRLAPEEHVFLFMPHHMIWDGWSFDVLHQEMAALLPALAHGGAEPPLPTVTYLDFAAWHARWMQGEECRAQLLWWKQRYAGVVRPEALPTDRPRGPGMTGIGAVEWVHVDKSLTERLRQVAREQGATVNMLVLAVYTALLTQALGQSSMIVGMPVRGRLSQPLETVMGFFNNLLPLPVKVQAELTLPGWLAQVKRDVLDAFANESVPFERLAGEPELAHLGQKAGLYQSLFSFQDARERPAAWGTLDRSSVLVMQKGATEDFGLWLMEVPAGLEGGFNYNSDLFDAATAALFRERLVGLLGRVADAPGQTVQALLDAPGRDRDQLLAWVARATGAVARPAAANPASTRPAAAPDPSEASMATIWSELLGVPVEQIATADNFFDLGGSSLLVMQATAAVEQRLGVKLDPRRFVSESLAQLSRQAADAGQAPAQKSPASVDTADRSAARDEMARIWAALLGVEATQIRPDDNFFDLGGSSLLVMRAAAEIEAHLGMRIEPRRFVAENLQQLAATSSTAPEPEVAVAAAATLGSTSPSKPGLLARVFGLRGRSG